MLLVPCSLHGARYLAYTKRNKKKKEGGDEEEEEEENAQQSRREPNLDLLLFLAILHLRLLLPPLLVIRVDLT